MEQEIIEEYGNLNIENHIKAMIIKALNTSCCRKCAANRLGIDIRTLERRQEQYGIRRNEKNKYVIQSSRTI